MNPELLPATAPDDAPAWQQTVVAFLAEKERRSGSRRTVESYARMLWPFVTKVGSPDRVTPAHVLAWAHGIGASGREPSSATVGALAKLDVLGFQRLESELTPDAIDLGLEAALPAVIELESKIGEFGRGERI
jgi:hypothetical protein